MIRYVPYKIVATTREKRMMLSIYLNPIDNTLVHTLNYMSPYSIHARHELLEG